MTPEELQSANRRMDTTLAQFAAATRSVVALLGYSTVDAEHIITEMHNPHSDTVVMLAERLNMPRDAARIVVGLPTDRPLARLERLNAYFARIGVSPSPPTEDR